jgi:hypothetical protein
MTYATLLERRRTFGGGTGFNPSYMPDFVFDFQQYLIEWSVRMGRGGIFADCGMGKTPMQLVWAENVRRHTNKPVLILTPLAVAHQTKREADKFGIESVVSRDGTSFGNITVTNYERLHYFNSNDFGGVVCDESSAIKNFDGRRRLEVTEFMRDVPYRLLCTATAAPNDYHELGTSSEALGYLGCRDMMTTFFKEEVNDDYLGWARTKYRFRGHAEQPFWRWVCSWARAIRRPSDLGFDDSRFKLPPLIENEIVIENSTPRSGMLFSIPARGLREEREERRITIQERCERVAELVKGDKPAVVWCHLNDEGDLLEKIIPDAKQVKGSMTDDAKEERLAEFGSGNLRVLVTKPKIGCWGLNWQHCSNVVTFPSHSYEQYYQLVRRCFRFGQENPVTVSIVSTEGEVGVTANLKRKAEQADRMFSSLVANMTDQLKIDGSESFNNTEKVPTWLSTTSALQTNTLSTMATAAR